MTRQRIDRVYELFHEIAALPEPERLDALRARCGDDDDLYGEVLALLRTGAADEDPTVGYVSSPTERTKVAESGHTGPLPARIGR